MPRNPKGKLVEKPDSLHAVAGEVAEVLHEVHREEMVKKEREKEAKINNKYLKDFACPVCGKDETSALDAIEPLDMNHAYAHVSCENCGAEWTEEWVLNAIFSIKKGNKENT